MASTYSALKIELIGTGEQSGTWGTTTNTNLGDAALGEAITGSADVAFSSADITVTLTDTNATQTARNLRLNLTGTSGGSRILTLGSGCQIEKLYLINNGLANQVTVKNTSGTGVIVPAGKTMFVYNNGTNVVDAVTYVTGTAASGTNSDITSLNGLTTPLAPAYGGTGATSLAAATIATQGYTTTATAAGTTTLTVSSTQLQFFTGATTQTVVLPVASTLTVGQRFEIHNNSTGTVTVNSSGANLVATVLGNTTIVCTCILTSGTTAASWDTDIQGFTTSVPVANGGTGATTAPAANANIQTYTTTATAAGTTTLTNASTYYQYFTGTQTQTVQLPVTSTLGLGWSFHIANNSTGNLTLNSSGANLVNTVLPGTTIHVTCIGTALTTAADWDSGSTDFGTVTGTGAVVLGTSPTLNNSTITNYVESVVSIGTVTTTNTLSLTNGTVQTATLTASTACTFTMPTATAGKSFILLLKQAATTGNGSATFTSVKFNSGGAPTITVTAGKMDILTFVADGTNWYGSYSQGYTP